MRKHVIAGILALSMLLSISVIGCGSNLNASTELEESKTSSEQELYLELHYENGTARRQEILCVSYYSFWLDGSWVSDKDCHSFNELTFSNWWSYIWSNACAELPDGKIYAFSGAYDIQIDEESNTIHLYLWQDEPSTLEAEEFELVED